MRVLVVDDERDTVLMLSAILRDEGHETKGAHSAWDALKLIQDFDPDVVVSDISMPGMTGWDLARSIRKFGSEARPLLIAVSGIYIKSADKVLAQMVGYRHFLQKPADPNELLALIAPLAASAR